MATYSVSETDDYLKKLSGLLGAAKTREDFFKAIVNAPFLADKRKTTIFGLGFISFVLVNSQTNTVDRTSISDTDTAQGAIDITVVPFKDLIVPLGAKDNIVVKAIKTGKEQQTRDWNDLLTPVLSPEEARLNQAGAGIDASFVYPLIGTKPAGATIFQYFVMPDKINKAEKEFMFRYTKLVSKTLRETIQADGRS